MVVKHHLSGGDDFIRNFERVHAQKKNDAWLGILADFIIYFFCIFLF